jgi:Uma2 family endonuclease
MSAAVHHPIARDDFLQWEERQPARYEFDGFQPVAMTGGSANHARIQRNLLRQLDSRLGNGPCEVFGSDLKIAVADAIRYPDAFVVCGPLRGKDNIVPNPVVVFEILSPSTQGTDLIRKNREYRATPSIHRYVILQQDQQAATVFSRRDDLWVADILTGDAILSMPEIGVDLPLADCYRGVEFPPPEPTEA